MSIGTKVHTAPPASSVKKSCEYVPPAGPTDRAPSRATVPYSRGYAASHHAMMSPLATTPRSASTRCAGTVRYSTAAGRSGDSIARRLATTDCVRRSSDSMRSR